VRSTITVSEAESGTQSGTVSRTVIPVMAWMVGAMLSMCWMSVETTVEVGGWWRPELRRHVACSLTQGTTRESNRPRRGSLPDAKHLREQSNLASIRQQAVNV